MAKKQAVTKAQYDEAVAGLLRPRDANPNPKKGNRNEGNSSRVHADARRRLRDRRIRGG